MIYIYIYIYICIHTEGGARQRRPRTPRPGACPGLPVSFACSFCFIFMSLFHLNVLVILCVSFFFFSGLPGFVVWSNIEHISFLYRSCLVPFLLCLFFFRSTLEQLLRSCSSRSGRLPAFTSTLQRWSENPQCSWGSRGSPSPRLGAQRKTSTIHMMLLLIL